MAKDGAPGRGRFTRSGHTQHNPNVPASDRRPPMPPAQVPLTQPTQAQPPQQPPPPPVQGYAQPPQPAPVPIQPPPPPVQGYTQPRYYADTPPNGPRPDPRSADPRSADRRGADRRGADYATTWLPGPPADQQPTGYLPPGARSAPHDTADFPAPIAAGGQLAIPGGPDMVVPPGTPIDPVTGAPQVTVTRAMVQRTKYLSQQATKKVIAASQADGARESGLTALIWNQVLSYASDAMITVALAGTVFFAATGSAQRGNVLMYLLITMAPFALIAPVIGPLLDRIQHGRRLALAATAAGRVLLAFVMAANFEDMFVLLPAALGSLVLSKAYSVIRGSATPRLVPFEMSLVTANARLSIFGLFAAIAGGGVMAAFIQVSGSYQWGLRLAAVAFAVTTYYALRLPKAVDSAVPAARHPGEPPRPVMQKNVPSIGRLTEWAGRGFDPQVKAALQAASALRGLSGFLTLFLAFYIQDTTKGFDALVDLAALGAAAGGGNFLGTAVGAKMKLGKPEILVLGCAAASTVMTVLTVLLFGMPVAIICVLVMATANSLGKLSLDAVIQQDVAETLRSSAFARSETFLQLAWVFGAALAAILPAGHGRLDLSVGAILLTVSVVFVLMRHRAVTRGTSAPHTPGGPITS